MLTRTTFEINLFHSIRVRPKLSCLREAAPLLDLDRDERKLDAFLQLHKSDLQVSDLRIFLPFTINLDPYLRKVLKGDFFFLFKKVLFYMKRFNLILKDLIFNF